MAIRNTGLGGATDWSDGEVLYAADLNDTFDVVADSPKPWYHNSSLYTVYDDFSGTLTLWNTSGTVSISSGEMRISHDSSAVSNALPSNKSYWCTVRPAAILENVGNTSGYSLSVIHSLVHNGSISSATASIHSAFMAALASSVRLLAILMSCGEIGLKPMSQS